MFPQVKETYSQTTLDKEKWACTKREVRSWYDSGALLAPCVIMQCIEFDMDFFRALVAKKARIEQPALTIKLAKRRRSPSVDSSGDESGSDPRRSQGSSGGQPEDQAQDSSSLRRSLRRKL